MATVGTMVVNLIARTEAFAKGMDASKKRIWALERQTAQTLRTVSRFAMVTAGAAVAGLTLLTKRAMENMDAIAKLSDRIGVSTEFLSAFGHAAGLAGTSSEAFNKSIEMFVRRMGETASGAGEAKRGMESLGLTTEELLNLSTEDAFFKVAEGIRGLGTQAEKAAVAYQFFGRSGSQMLNLLQGDISGVIDRAKELRITFSREQAARIEEANDALTRMRSAWQGIGNTIAIAVSPMIQELADRVTEMTSGQNSIEAITKHIQNAAYAMTYLHDGFLMIYRTLEKIVGLSMRLYAISMIIPEIISRKLGFTKAADWLQGIGKGLWDVGGEKLSKEWDIGKMRSELESFFEDSANRTFDIVRSSSAGHYVDELEDAARRTTPGSASAREIRSSLVSVSGLSMGGVIDKQDTTNQLLQEVNRNLRELKNDIRMN